MKKKSLRIFWVLALAIITCGCGKSVREETPREELDRMVHEEEDLPAERRV